LGGEYNKQTKKRAGPLNPQFPTTHVTGLGSLKKLMKHIAKALCIILRKHKPAITVAATVHFPFASFK